MKKIILIVVTFVVLALAVSFFLTNIFSIYGNRIISVIFDEKVLHAEVVSTGEKLERGLGNRKSLCDSCAMLFKFQKTGKYSFWMKGMLIPLDIVWISEGKVAYLEKNIQPDFKGVLTPAENANAVLEINAGRADELGIEIGDHISF